MTPHNHSTFVEGCYRCELNLDEMATPTPEGLRERITEALTKLCGCSYREVHLQAADAVLDALRLEQVGVGFKVDGRFMVSSVRSHQPPKADPALEWVPVFVLRSEGEPQ